MYKATCAKNGCTCCLSNTEIIHGIVSHSCRQCPRFATPLPCSHKISGPQVTELLEHRSACEGRRRLGAAKMAVRGAQNLLASVLLALFLIGNTEARVVLQVGSFLTEA